MKGSIAAAVVLFSVLFVGSASEPKDRNSYCMPNQACWPTEDELKTFSSGLDGEVITPSSPRYDDESLINNRRFILQPGLIVEVASAEDVVSSLGFAREHNIRVTVISTGHDYDARNSGDGTLQISLKQMKRMSVVDGEGNTAFIRVETGLTWGEVHLFLYLTRPDKIAVGGADLSVGVGGWVLGGGHSPFSSMAGLGVDSVVSFDVALANGTIITASNCENQEIFWALRGASGCFANTLFAHLDTPPKNFRTPLDTHSNRTSGIFQHLLTPRVYIVLRCALDRKLCLLYGYRLVQV